MRKLDHLYNEYAQEQSYDNEKALFHELQQYSIILGAKVFTPELLPDTREIIQEAAENAMLKVRQHDPKAGKFSTFAHRVILCDFYDWIEDCKKREMESIDDPNMHADQVIDLAVPVDTRTYYKQVLAQLTTRERTVFQLVAEGRTMDEMASLLGQPRSSVHREWQAIQMRLKRDHLAGQLRIGAI